MPLASERLAGRSALALALVLLAGCPTSGAGAGPDGAGSGGTSTGGVGTGGANGSGGQTATGSGGEGTASGGAGAGTGGTGTGGGVDQSGGRSGGSVGSGNGGSSGAPGGSGAIGGAIGGKGGSAGSAGNGGGATACPGRRYDAASPPQVLTLSGSLGAHDPTAYVVGNTIYLAATGLIGKTSTNLTTWSNAPTPLALPQWARTATGAANLWAPDISFFGGMYHLYYSASTFGSNKSCIGHATRPSLDSGSWADMGMMLCSNMGSTDNWNAIDPNIVLDDAGTPWMAFGSFWSGLKLVKLTSAGVRADTTLVSIASGANARGSLEGAWIFKACGYYYLFSSWGACCDGAFDYNMRVGRATTITGPYVDKAGTSLTAGGGTLLVQGNTSWGAPGHQSVIVYDNKVYNIYHALQGGRGTATLRIAEIVWDDAGWPVTAGP